MTTTVKGVGIVADSVGWTYYGRTQPALDAISFSISPGSFVLVKGPSGSGKSTLGLLIAGLLENGEDGAFQGQLEVGSGAGPVGYVLQQPDDQTVMPRIRDDVAFGLENIGVDPGLMDEVIDRVLRDVGLDTIGHTLTKPLSGGQRQRLAIAGALAMTPGLLVLDEPTSALDAPGRDAVVKVVGELHARYGLTVVVIDHHEELWSELVTATITLERGHLVEGNSRVSEGYSRPIGIPAAGDVVLRAESVVASPDAVSAVTSPLSLELRAGQVLALVGPNGSGKSTLAMTLAGVLRPLAGQITEPSGLSELSSKELSHLVGYVPQNPALLFGRQSVEKELSDTGASSEDVTRTLRVWNLEHLSDRHPHTLSGGEQRRLALAIATIHRQTLLVLDEPTQGLDAASRSDCVRELTFLLSSGVAVVMATHDDELVGALQANVLRLERVSQAPVVAAQKSSPITRANPLAVMTAVLVPALMLLATLDVVSASVVLAASLVALPLIGVSLVSSTKRLAPVVLAAILAGVTITLYGESSGDVYFSWGIIEVSEGSLDLALATSLRILALGVPAVLVLSHLDTTRLADALAVNARLPERFVLGGLAGLRLFDVLEVDFESRRRMERVRGWADRSSFVRFFSMAITGFVIALRRSETLARAMQSRGFGARSRRTHYRTMPWRLSDTGWVLGGLSVGALALVVAAWSGEFNAVFG